MDKGDGVGALIACCILTVYCAICLPLQCLCNKCAFGVCIPDATEAEKLYNSRNPAKVAPDPLTPPTVMSMLDGSKVILCPAPDGGSAVPDGVIAYLPTVTAVPTVSAVPIGDEPIKISVKPTSDTAMENKPNVKQARRKIYQPTNQGIPFM